MEEQDVIIGIGDFAVAHNPKMLSALGLGSCVAVALYDREAHIGGLAHIMLPASKEFSGTIEKDRSTKNLTKYADISIPEMIGEMEKIGAQKKKIFAKIAGGAQMFPTLSLENCSIGKRNAEAVKKILRDNDIPIEAEDLGGNVGRSIRFDITTQKMKVKTIRSEKEI